ncbi:MAG: hypothetical protein AAGD07_12890 [Planctomycetota bacterium]
MRQWSKAGLAIAIGVLTLPPMDKARAGLFDDCLTGGCDRACDVMLDDSACDSGMCSDSRCLDAFASVLDGCSLIQRSDHCFDDFISPMIDFVHFEDPRTLTELRPIFVHHRFPSGLGPSNIPAGGDIQLFALQFRIALSERLSIIAVKDGYIIDNSEGALDGLLNSGWADVTAGLKYNLIRDTCRGTLASVGFTYEIPMGSEGSLQALGDGEFHFFGSAGQRFLDGDAHWLTSFGYQVPVDTDVQSTTIHWLNHLDLRLTKKAYVFTELSWWHWVDDAEQGAALGVSGQDLINLGSTDVVGNDLVTQNVGLKYKPHGGFEAGMAYEFPLTAFKDVIQDRWQFEMIFRY